MPRPPRGPSASRTPQQQKGVSTGRGAELRAQEKRLAALAKQLEAIAKYMKNPKKGKTLASLAYTESKLSKPKGWAKAWWDSKQNTWDRKWWK